MKWQQVLALIIAGVLTTFAGIANLTGVEVSYSGDSDVCYGCDGYAYINYTSSYWRICFEHSKGKYMNKTVYKKQARSRTLWFNLDKITFTDPSVKTSFQTATRGKDNWRDVKDGDCIERKTKSRPQPNRFRLVGHNLTNTTKWFFQADYFLLEETNIDPLWRVINNMKEINECKSKIVNKNIKQTTMCDYERTEKSCLNLLGENTSCVDKIIKYSEKCINYSTVQVNQEVCKTKYYYYKGDVIDASEWCCNKETLECDSRLKDGNGDCKCDDGEDCIYLDKSRYAINDMHSRRIFVDKSTSLKRKVKI
ncbi:MAG: hypothetical protein ACTSX6_04850 [Candidatus Heimdallarchaeaceae archaeon]